MDRTPWAVLAVIFSLTGCAGTQREPAHAEEGSSSSAGASIAKAGSVALSSFALAGRMAVQGLATAGSAVGGFVVDGKAGAKREWDASAKEAENTGRREAAKVRAAAKPKAK